MSRKGIDNDPKNNLEGSEGSLKFSCISRCTIPTSEPLEQAKFTLDMKLKEVEFHLMIGTDFMDEIFAQSLYSLLGCSQNRGSKLVSCSSSPSFWFSCECCKSCTIGIQFMYRNV